MQTTTASITPCFARPPERLAALGRLAIVLACLLFLTPLRAETAFTRQAIAQEDGHYVVDADFTVTLNRRIADAITHGITVYFVLEAEIREPRWYWADQVRARKTRSYALSYHALTRSYRVSRGSLHHSFSTLGAALASLHPVREWRVATTNEVEPGREYVAALRFRLDSDLLPRPFKASAVGSRDWTVDTEWVTWPFLANPESIGRNAQ